MALTSLCFDTKMKAVLRKYRVELVSSLQVDDLLDHLIRDHVFEYDDYIKVNMLCTVFFSHERLFFNNTHILFTALS